MPNGLQPKLGVEDRALLSESLLKTKCLKTAVVDAINIGMTKKLEQLFDLPESDNDSEESVDNLPLTRETLQALDEAIDKVDAALPAVRDLDASDAEMDALSKTAQDSYRELMELGMQVDSRFASEIFSVASNMLGHAITAKNSKLDKKLKMIDLQLKKMRLDQQQQIIDKKSAEEEPPAQTGEAAVLSRNDLLERLLQRNQQNTKKE